MSISRGESCPNCGHTIEESELVDAVVEGWELLSWTGDTEEPETLAARKRIERAVTAVKDGLGAVATSPWRTRG